MRLAILCCQLGLAIDGVINGVKHIYMLVVIFFVMVYTVIFPLGISQIFQIFTIATNCDFNINMHDKQ